MSRRLGVGVIGMGWMGMAHSRCYRLVPDRFNESKIEPILIVCADEVEKRAQEAQQRFGFSRYTTDWQEVVSDPHVDVVNVTAPNAMHLEIVRAAAKAGKHIFCEKPVGRSPQETAEIEYAARQAGVFTWVGYNYRWPPVVRYAKQLIEEGKLGELTHYRGRFLVGYGSNSHGVLSWRFQRELAGMGTLGDLMSHVVDTAHMVVGPIKRLAANQHTFIKERPLATHGEGTHFSVSKDGPKGEVTNDDYVGLLVQFSNGVQGTLEACRVIFGPKCEMAFEVNGTKGALSWNFERMNELNLFLPDGNPMRDGPVQLFGDTTHPFYAQWYPGPAISMGYEDLKVIEMHEFSQSVLNGKQGQPGFTEALAVADVQHTAQLACKSDRWEDVVSVRRS